MKSKEVWEISGRNGMRSKEVWEIPGRNGMKSKKVWEMEPAGKKKVLMLASVASMIDQFNLPNIRLMQELGYEVHVACNFKQGNTCNAGRLCRLWKELENRSVRCHQWDCPRELLDVRKCRKAFGQLLRLTREHRFAWMHCHSPIGAALARIVAHTQGIPVIYTAHGFHFYQGAPWFYWLVYYPAEKLLSYWTDVLITVNREDFQLARRRLHARRVYRIPGVGIDIRHYAQYQPCMTREEFCRKYRLPLDAKILLSVGELSRRKNHQLVVSMLPWLEKPVCYMVCGQGACYGRLASLARETGVSDRVSFPGYVEDLREIYWHADIFVFPSLQEGLPVALLEAMASGLPCFVSDIRGNRELVRMKSCRFAPGNRQEFLRGMQRLLENQRLREYSRQQLQKQAVRYAIKAVEKKTSRIYKRMEETMGT